MSKNFESGVGTGPNDEVFQYRGQAQSAFRTWIGSLFGGNVPPGQRSADGRTVLYEDPAKGVKVTARGDRGGKNVVPVKGSIDTKSQVKTPRGRVISETKHFGYTED